MCISIKTQARLLALVLATGFAACANQASESAAGEAQATEMPSGPIKDEGPWEAGDLIASGKSGVANIQILEVHANGTGEICGTGKKASLKYVAMKASGEVIDPGNAPFKFTVGRGESIEGWDIIVAKMRVGDSLTLIVPDALAYPRRSNMKDLKFDMELLSFN